MMKLLGAVVAMVALAGAAEAGEWKLGHLSDTSVVGFDRSSVRIEGDRRFMWMVVIPLQEGENAGRHVVTRMEFDCRLDRMRTVSLNMYDDFVQTDRSDEIAQYQNVVPDSGGDAMLKAACRDEWAFDIPGVETIREFVEFGQKVMDPEVVRRRG